MGGALKSAGGFLGLSDGPKAPDGNFNNTGLQGLNAQNDIYGNPNIGVMGDLSKYAQGGLSSNDILNKDYGNPSYNTEAMNALATGPITGSKFATEQVQNSPLLGQLFGQDGQLSKEVGQYGQQSGILDKLQNQGYQLTPEDHTLYGQASGNIARQFGQQGNQMANDLASRGLSSSGAAGAQFSGLAGNQNEQLAQAQQGIMQQRFQNTMNQIGQQQNFLSQLGGNINNMGNSAENAVQQQYGRQSAGAGAQKGALGQAGGLQQGANNAQNAYGMEAANFNVANTPANFMDYYTSGMGKGMQQQGNNMTDPFNSGSGSPGSIGASQQKSMSGGGGGGGGGLFSMAAMA